jgi:hypothetical protein
VLAVGQCIKHAQFGVGVVSASNSERTAIDFYDHGVKQFVTAMLNAELVDSAPPRPRPARRTSKAAAARKTAEGK